MLAQPTATQSLISRKTAYNVVSNRKSSGISPSMRLRTGVTSTVTTNPEGIRSRRFRFGCIKQILDMILERFITMGGKYGAFQIT